MGREGQRTTAYCTICGSAVTQNPIAPFQLHHILMTIDYAILVT
jgi:hypothetical protein